MSTMHAMETNRCFIGDCREIMCQMLASGGGQKVQTIVMSPPYWCFRDYGIAGQIGQETTPQEYVDTMAEVFALAHELLANDRTLRIVIGTPTPTMANGDATSRKHVRGLQER